MTYAYLKYDILLTSVNYQSKYFFSQNWLFYGKWLAQRILTEPAKKFSLQKTRLHWHFFYYLN